MEISSVLLFPVTIYPLKNTRTKFFHSSMHKDYVSNDNFYASHQDAWPNNAVGASYIS